MNRAVSEHRFCLDCYAVERRFHRDWPERPRHKRSFDPAVRCCYCGTLTRAVAIVETTTALLACKGSLFHHAKEGAE